MGKSVKISLWAIGLLAAAGLAAGLALKLYFTPLRVKNLVRAYASSGLNREVDFKSATLDLSGFAITGLRVSENPGFSKGEFFSAETFSVRPSLRDLLLRREVKIRSVSAVGLKLKIAELKKGVYNFSDLLGGEAGTGAARTKAGAASGPFGISKLSVKDSQFSYRNAAGDLSFSLKKFGLNAKNISPDGLFPLETAFTLNVALPGFKAELPVYLKGKTALGNWDPRKGRAEIEKATLSLGDLKFGFRGKLADLMEPDAELSLSVEPFSSTALKPFFPAAPPRILLPAIDADASFKLAFGGLRLNRLAFMAGPVSGNLKGSLAWAPRLDYSFTTELKAQVPEMDSAVAAKKLKMIPAGFNIPLTDVKAALSIRPAAVEVRSFDARAKDITLSGSAALKFSPALQASVKLKAELADLARLSKLSDKLKPYALSGRAEADLSCSWANALAVSGKAGFSGVGAEFAARKLSVFKGTLDFSKDAITSGPLSGKLDGEELKGSFSVKNYASSRPKAAFDFKLARLLVKDLPVPAAGEAAKKPAPGKTGPEFLLDLSGAAEIAALEHPNFSARAIVFKCDLKNISQDLKTLSGGAAFSTGGGRLAELYALAKQYKAAKVALYPLLAIQKASKLAKGLNLPDFNNIAFDSIEGEYLFDKGLMKISKSRLVSAVADASSSGSINLGTETLDLKLNTALKEASGVRMSTPLTLLVTGTMDSPSVKPDIKSVMQQPAVKKAAEQGVKMLRNLFKK